MQMTDINQRLTLLCIALFQGLALLVLHQSIEQSFWPSYNLPWLFGLYSFTLVTPTILLLALNNKANGMLYAFAMLAGSVALLLGYYTGTQVSPFQPQDSYGELIPVLVGTLSIATFKGLMYIQHFTVPGRGEEPTYSRLFKLSWRNFLTFGAALVFMLCFWGILKLWGALFDAIDITFFETLFEQPHFYYPILSLANGVGIAIFRQQSGIIDTLTRIQQALMKFLLVVLIFVSIIFLLSLPFTGLTPLWESGGSLLILWMQAILLFFTNAVYQDDPNQRPYPTAIHRFIYIGLALLPIYSIISAYGLYVRIEQYGWSVDRCWAWLLWSLLTLFSCGYSWSIVSKRDNWLYRLNWINIRMGVVVLGSMLLVNTPILDFRKISAHSQINLLSHDDLVLEEVDFYYLRYNLAKPGYDALNALKAKHPDNLKLTIKIDALFTERGKAAAVEQDTLIATINVLNGELPESLEKPIYDMMVNNVWLFRQLSATYLQPIDLNKDQQTDYLLITEQEGNRIQIYLFYFADDQWKHSSFGRHEGLSESQIIDDIRHNKMEVKPPVWNILKIGDHELQLRQ
ncbi:DUF4153 domain-containing protein [Neptunomonas sp. CHC150]|uniref:DUF4153 domain-containing protein n=1 Tax=Neptunomonas sp. CHC150 TaxID=2998324 RepID=UPI0025B1E651|nr:DUF4153 domain-containing protein [Neptunomonas sp. CHC150]MDN2659916.1 DUF4153 domain-containing protein [Neptunomonas sp. CHC150]